MIWTRPLILLLLLPWLLWCVWRWRRLQRQGAWHQLMDERLLQRLNYRGDVRRQSLTRGALLLAGVLMIVAAAGPARPLAGGETLTAGNLIVVLDSTLSMTVEDTSPSRTVRADRVIQDWAGSGVFERTAVVVYSGSSHWLVPLTRDTETLALQLEQMSPYIMPQFGNRPELAFERVNERLTTLPGRTQVLWITDDASPDRIEALQSTRPAVERFWVMPIGTQAGGPIPLPDGSGFLRDGSRMVLPTVDRAAFRDVAARLNATLIPMEQSVASLGLTIDPGEASSDRQVREFGYWLLLPALVLLLPWYRRGLVYCLPLGLVTGLAWQPMPANAEGWADPLLKNREQRAFDAFVQGDTERSRELTERTELAAQLAFEQGDYEQAAELWRQRDNADAHYNRANALAHQGRLEEAIDAYDEALARADHADARFNRERVAEALKQQREQQQQQQEQQDNNADEQQQGDSQDQNQQGEQQQNQDGQPGQPPDEQQQGEQQSEGESPEEPDESQAQESEADGEPPPDLEARRRDQAVEQLLNRVPSAEGQVLQRKFQYQYQQDPTQEEPDSLW